MKWDWFAARLWRDPELREGLISAALGLLKPCGLRAARSSSIAGAIDQTLFRVRTPLSCSGLVGVERMR